METNNPNITPDTIKGTILTSVSLASLELAHPEQRISKVILSELKECNLNPRNITLIEGKLNELISVIQKIIDKTQAILTKNVHTIDATVSEIKRVLDDFIKVFKPLTDQERDFLFNTILEYMIIRAQVSLKINSPHFSEDILHEIATPRITTFLVLFAFLVENEQKPLRIVGINKIQDETRIVLLPPIIKSYQINEEVWKSERETFTKVTYFDLIGGIPSKKEIDEITYELPYFEEMEILTSKLVEEIRENKLARSQLYKSLFQEERNMITAIREGVSRGVISTELAHKLLYETTKTSRNLLRNIFASKSADLK